MAGGSGTRFWPYSRKNRPKQLLNITGHKTMIQATVDRITPFIPPERIMVVTNSLYVDELKRQVPSMTQNQILTEPVGKNTAPCIALAAYKLRKIDPDAIMVVLPADHLIGKEQEFLDALEAAVAMVSNDAHLLTFGIVPNRPETGYGYLKIGEPLQKISGKTVYKVAQFVEKPNLATAESYCASGQYLWNSGMFVWKVSTIINALEKHLPQLSGTMQAISDCLGTSDELQAVHQAYEMITPISIDHGVMEKANNVCCIPIDVDWNDVGSWVSLETVWDRDANGNAVKGSVLSVRSSGCIISSPHKLVTLIGAEDLIVVDTPDVLMICRKDSAQEVRELQELLKREGYEHLL